MDRQQMKDAFEIERSTREVCLLIHGFCGTPAEMRLLADDLARRGYSVSAVLLAGHGTTMEDMISTGWWEWLDSAVQEFCRLQEKYQKVHVIGQSMGAMIALYLAEHYDPATVIALAPAVRLADKRAKWAGLLRHFVKYRVWDPMAILEETKDYLRSYPQMPVDGQAKLQRIIHLAGKNLERVTEPALFVWGVRDEIIDHKAAAAAFARISSKKKEWMLLPRSGHVVTLDADREQMFQRIGRFLAEN